MPLENTSRTTRMVSILIACVIIIAAISAVVLYSNKFQTNNSVVPAIKPPTSAKAPIAYEVVLKQNTTDTTKTDIFLKDPETQKETLSTSLVGVYTDHYHAAEYHNGNVYVLTRTADPAIDSHWTDELWKVDKQKQMKKLFSGQGLDFRVSDDENMIFVATSKTEKHPAGEFSFIDTSGAVVKTFSTKEIFGLTKKNAGGNMAEQENINPLKWSGSVLWMTNGVAAATYEITKINTSDFSIIKYNVSKLPINMREFDLNPRTERIVLSDYPTTFAVDDAANYFKTNGPTVHLIIYDLNTQTKKEIITSNEKQFEPKWVSDTTIEYNNPAGEGRTTMNVVF